MGSLQRLEPRLQTGEPVIPSATSPEPGEECGSARIPVRSTFARISHESANRGHGDAAEFPFSAGNG